MKFLVLALCVIAATSTSAWVTLTADEVAVVKSTWDHVKHNEIDILTAVFKAHPDIQAKFPAFVGKDLNAIKGSAAFAQHATRIVSFLSSYVGLLGHEENQAAIKTLLNEMGHNHVNRGVSKAQFTEFQASLVAYMKAHVSWGANVEHAWGDAFDKMNFVLFANLEGHAIH